MPRENVGFTHSQRGVAPQPRVYPSEQSAGCVHVPALTFNLLRFEGFTYGPAMRVLIACSDAGVRDAFVDVLRRADIDVMAVADAAATLELARQRRPDVMLVDDELPGIGGVAGLQRLAAEISDSELVVLAARFDRGSGVRAVLAGAAGYISRAIAAEALPRIVRGVMRGEAAIPRTLAMALIERHRMLARSEVGMRPTESPLSSGEQEVLDLMATGASPREIATELVVPLETVQSREQHILGKLGIHSRAAAIVIAQELRHRRPG
jgi:DNA-binding NarL/FixJ family response regulator